VGKTFDGIDEKLAHWIGRQRMFFVGTAPLDVEGHVNVSPKGAIESFRVLDPQRVCYLDFIGSGTETIAHIRENGRVVVMFCAFEGPPRIVRLHGRGHVVLSGEPEFAAVSAELGFNVTAPRPGWRAIVTVDVARIADSCGYGVPLLDYRGERTQQRDWIDRKLRAGDGALVEYVREKNSTSIDGLDGVDAALVAPAE
jgi:pyridoxamine 5'-phosphate oxidase-like protein